MARKTSVQKEVEKGLKAAGIPYKKAKELAESNTPAEYKDPVPEKVEYTPEEADEVEKLLSVIDGITTSQSYVVAAIKGTNGKLCIKKLMYGAPSKVKFYPSFEHWGITTFELNEEYAASGFDTFRRQYHRCFMPPDKVKQLIATLSALKTRPSAPKNSRLLVAAWGSIEEKLGQVPVVNGEEDDNNEIEDEE